MTIQPYETPERLPATELDQQALTWVSRLRAAAEIANYIGDTEFVPDALRNRPEAITSAILYGQEVGLEPMRALAMVVVIKGTPALRAEAQRSLILAAGHELWFDESTVTRAVAAGRRRGSDRVGRITFTLDDAKRAGLSGQPTYQKYPAEMLRARASAALARAMFADIIGGLAAVEELEGEPANGTPELEQQTPKRASTRRRTKTAAEPSPPPDTQPEPPIPDKPAVTDAQSRQIFALMRDAGIENRDDRLDYTASIIGRTITSSTELTQGEASLLIDALIERLSRTQDEQATVEALKELAEDT